MRMVDIGSVVRGEAGRASRLFDILAQAVIAISIVGLILQSIPDLNPSAYDVLNVVEVSSILFFAAEYGIRIFAAKKKTEYLLSFWGVVDFVAIIPTIMFAAIDLRALRALRLLRLVRILKLGRYSRAMQRLAQAAATVRDEFLCFLFLAAIVFFLAASGIYYFENDAQPDVFSSIPAAMWWAVATLTTVGYGDIYPVTLGGKLFTAVILMIGLGLVAIPAGLIAAALHDTGGKGDEG